MQAQLKKQLALFDEDSAQPPIKHESFRLLCEKLGVEQTSGWIDRFGEALHRWARETIRTPIQTLSLFSGAGGLDIGFHDAGFQINAMVEIEDRFAATLRANVGTGKYLGDAEIFNQDIRQFHPATEEKIDFIIGGPPCQPFSAAARRAAGVKGTTDEQGQLFEEYVRLLQLLNPKGFLFENVYGITGAEQGQAWRKIIEAFKNAGYQIAFRLLDAADYGVPQHRERMFIVGSRNNLFEFPCPTHGTDSPEALPAITAWEALKNIESFDNERLNELGGRYGHLLKEIPPGLNYSFFTEKMGHPTPIFAWRSKFSDFLYKAEPTSPVRTLKAQIGQYSGPFHWDNRPFTVAEFKRLQTFPDSYQIIGGRQSAIHQIGNSVPPQIARILAISILNQVFDVELPCQLPLLERGAELSFRKRKQNVTRRYREKAKAAIGNASRIETEIQGRSYQAVLLDDFTLRPSSNGNAALTIDFSVQESNWEILISPLQAQPPSSFMVKIQPSAISSWGLPTGEVVLRGASEKEAFTAAWKAFEAEVIRLNLKADLVQLCGYYQYKPTFCAEMTIGENSKEWDIVRKTVGGVAVGYILRYTEIAKLWNVTEREVLGYAKWLKQLGYEVRNHRTNPQIPNDHLLIPYIFPTLTTQSVQLRKSLGDDDAQNEK